MTKLHKVALLPLGKITVKVDEVTGTSIPYVYQRVKKGTGNIVIPGPYDLQLRRHVQQSPGFTYAQMDKRLRFQAAIQAWQQMAQGERQPYKDRARTMDISGYNLFIREFMDGLIQWEGIWDTGASDWDFTPSTWDEDPPTTWDDETTDWDTDPSHWYD